MTQFRRWLRRVTATPLDQIRILNLTRGMELASHAEVAVTAAARNKGLLGRTTLLRGEGMWIAPCSSVHTFFMKFSIDLIYLDRKRHIKKVRSSVKPWRVSVCLGAYSVVELPSGVIDRTQTARGDQLDLTVLPINSRAE